VLRAGQRIPDAGETKASEVGFMARGELGYPVMPQRESESGVENNAATNVRLGGQTPQFVHHTGTFAGIVEQRPGRMLAERLDDGDRVRRIERVLQDGGVAEQDQGNFWPKFWKLYGQAKDPDARKILRPPIS
jgi:hypothetical protein